MIVKMMKRDQDESAFGNPNDFRKIISKMSEKSLVINIWHIYYQL